MAHGKEFYDEKIPELVKLYKGGATIAELKKKWRCNGNPLVARLKEAGVYKAGGAIKRAKKAVVKHKAAKKAHKAAATPGPTPENAATATTAKAKGTKATTQQAKSAFTPEREKRIAEIIEQRKCTRRAAIQQLWNEEAIREADSKAQPQAETKAGVVDPLASATPVYS